MGYTAMIQEGLFGEINQKQTEGLIKVMEQSTELLRLVSGILDITQIEAGVAKIDGAPVYLNQFLGELKISYEIPMKKQLSFFWDYADDLPMLHTDAIKLKHILHNLLNNAIKFTEQGTVAFSVRHLLEENKTQFKVKDTGIGIAKEDLEIIFEMFRQVDSSETRHYDGVGIGLFVVRRYTELLGGTVEVTTEAGKGSTFTVTIPCVCKS